MEKASSARQTQGLHHSVTPGKDFQSVRQADTQNKDLRKESVAIPPALSEQLPQPMPSGKSSDLRGQAGCPVSCQREDLTSIFPGAGQGCHFLSITSDPLWTHQSSTEIQAVF